MAKTRYVWSSVSDSVLQEKDGTTGVTQVTYTNEPAPYGPLRSERRGSETRQYHFDALGSTRALTDDSQAVTDTFAYDSWGNMFSHTGTASTQYSWNGRWGYLSMSEQGAYSVRHRIFKATLARWMSEDPLEFVDGNNQFVIRSVTSRIDPTGLLSILPIRPFPQARCGQNAVYGWDFVLPKNAGAYCKNAVGLPTGGYFIQKIEVWCERSACPPCKDCKTAQGNTAPDYSFYEAWAVDKDSRVARYRDTPNNGSLYTDQFNFAPEDGYCGYHDTVGEVMFFCVGDTGDLGDIGNGKKWKTGQQFFGKNCEGSPGDAPATNDPAAVAGFWPAKAKGGPADTHYLFCVYQCCGKSGGCKGDTANCSAIP